MSENIEQVLEKIVQGVVNHPDKVSISQKTDSLGILFTVKVDPSDTALIIGKKGATINLIKNLMTIVGAKHKTRVSIRLDVPPLA